MPQPHSTLLIPFPRLLPLAETAPPPGKPRSRAPRGRRALLELAWIEAPLRTALRGFAGLVFLYLGALKISVKTFEHSILGTHGLSLVPGPAGFAQYLAAAGIPLPVPSAYLVLAVELFCGLGLLLGAFLPLAQLLTRLFALALAGDMLVAIAVTGLPNLLGHPVLLQGVPAMTQAWRFPLEVALLGVMTYFLLRPVLRRAPFALPKLRLLTEPPRLRWPREFAQP